MLIDLFLSSLFDEHDGSVWCQVLSASPPLVLQLSSDREREKALSLSQQSVICRVIWHIELYSMKMP